MKELATWVIVKRRWFLDPKFRHHHWKRIDLNNTMSAIGCRDYPGGRQNQRARQLFDLDCPTTLDSVQIVDRKFLDSIGKSLPWRLQPRSCGLSLSWVIEMKEILKFII
jgi:hypothetical protein